MAALQCVVSICFTRGHSCVVSQKLIAHFQVMIPCEGNGVRLSVSVCEGGPGRTMNDIQAEMSSHGWERKFHYGLCLVVDRTRTMPVLYPTTSTVRQ